MVKSLPSRTAAIMPHPHEQKLQEVVNSLTSESFRSFVAARIAGTSRSPPSASPDPPPKVSFNRSLRFIVGGFRIGAPGDLSIGLLRVTADRDCHVALARTASTAKLNPR